MWAMKNVILSILLLAGACLGSGLVAASNQAPAKESPGQESPQSADEKAIRSSTEAFVAAFNQGDAKTIGLMWTSDAEYVEETGRIFRGRDAIEKEYSSFFTAHPGLKMANSIVSLKIVGGNAAIEQGDSMVKGADGRIVSKGSYTALLVKEAGKWLMVSVREHASPSLAVRPLFADLDWLIGEWAAEKDGTQVRLTARWVAEKKFIELSYRVSDKDRVVRSGLQIIGPDPSSGEVASWSFDSSGGCGRGHWKLLKNGWIAESRGVMPDGAPTVSTDLVSRIDGEHVRWQSVNRSVAGKPVDNSPPVVLTRTER
jgi:uncharacterized protein (TIGR02246 family)